MDFSAPWIKMTREHALAGARPANSNHVDAMIQAVSIRNLTSPRFKDHSGQRFGKLVVSSVSHKKFFSSGKSHIFWNAVCDCGNRNVFDGVALVIGTTKSCGCLWLPAIKKSNTRHGRSKTSEYKIWSGMRKRCSPTTKSLCRTYYYDRGIRVCKRWESFENFLSDMGPRPSDKFSVERKNNDGPYSPENCFWGTDKQQGRNTRRNVFLTAIGKTMCISEWAEFTGLRYATIYNRFVINKWPATQAVTQPARKILK